VGAGVGCGMHAMDTICVTVQRNVATAIEEAGRPRQGKPRQELIRSIVIMAAKKQNQSRGGRCTTVSFPRAVANPSIPSTDVRADRVNRRSDHEIDGIETIGRAQCYCPPFASTSRPLYATRP
jgi:hypothetical protein